VLAELIAMNRVDDEPGEPSRLPGLPGHGYLASSRSARRYFLAALAATFSARSASGS
jgi:hypothetical protein